MSSPAISLEERILSYLSSKPRHRLAPREIQKALGPPLPGLQETEGALRRLVKKGKAVKLRRNHYALPERQNLIAGRVHAHPDGYGFLVADDPAQGDVYLSRREMRRVLHGDRVVARINRRQRGGTEGRILQVLERGQKRIIGTFEEVQGKCTLIPMDPRVAPLVLSLPGEEKPGHGKVITAEIMRYGTAYSPAEARLVELLGDPDDPEVQARSIIFRYGLPTTFTEEAQREASSCLGGLTAEELAGRVNLRSIPMVTIDGETARDFDDAVSIERREGRYFLYVSIADVAHYVARQTALDREAYDRGTSVYFPDRALPMLPPDLSTGICSLNPEEDRLTNTVLLQISGEGRCEKARFFRSVIRSHRRLTYTDVRRVLVDRDREFIDRFGPLAEQLKRMEELALLLWEERRAKGSLDFDLPETEIVLDLQGSAENVKRAERHIGHRIIEEFMIAANEAVARHLQEKELPFLYRVHEGPDKEALQGLDPFLRSLGYRLPLRQGKISPLGVQGVLEACHGKPEERVLNRVLLRAMKQAHYSPENPGHFGLASSCYTHFTSPIRRYPDLIIHRILHLVLERKKWKPKEKEELADYLEIAAKHTSERERIAMEAEREMVDLKKTQFMLGKIGEEFAGFIIHLTSFGFFVELEPFFVEGLVRLSTLTDDSYQFYEKEQVIRGRRYGRAFRLGDPVRIRVTRVHAFRAEIDFTLTGE